MAQATGRETRSAKPRERAPLRLTPVVQLTLPRELIEALDRWAARATRERLGTHVSRSQAARELLGRALSPVPEAAADQGAPAPVRRVHAYRLGEEPVDDYARTLTAAERLKLASELTLAAYEMKGHPLVPGIRRDIVRVIRDGR